MRFIKTFVLHLYTDLDAFDQLCGDLKALPDNKALPFKNQAGLIALLDQAIRHAPEKPGYAGNPPDPDNSAKDGSGSEIA